MDRLKVLSNHVNPRSQWSVATRDVAGRESPSFMNSPDDIVVVAAKRTPIGKAKRGSFKVARIDINLGGVFSPLPSHRVNMLTRKLPKAVPFFFLPL